MTKNYYCSNYCCSRTRRRMSCYYSNWTTRTRSYCCSNWKMTKRMKNCYSRSYYLKSYCSRSCYLTTRN